MPDRVHLQLAPGESPAAGTPEACARLLEDPRVAAVLVPLRPEGGSRTARAARRYVAAWDARFVHDNAVYAPAARVAARVPPGGATSADAAEFLQDALDRGHRVAALREGAVLSPFARDLDAWVAWARGEGAAWGALARRDARFARLGPARTRGGWLKHNVAQVTRRVGEVTQALRRVDPPAAWLHLAREAAWTGAFVRAFNEMQQL